MAVIIGRGTRELVFGIIALGGLALAFALFAAGDGWAQERQITFGPGAEVHSLALNPSKAITIETNVDFAELVVGNPEIADVSPLTSRSLYILARTYGRTNLSFYDDQSRLVGVLDLTVALDLGEVRDALNSALPHSSLNVSLVNGRIRIGGVLADGMALRTALDIVEQFTSEPVINTIRVSNSQQVMLQVRFLEARRDAGRDLGIGWKGANTNNPGYQGESDIPYIAGVDQQYPGFAIGGNLASSAIPFGTFIANILSSGITADVIVKALETKGLARRLAEPNLIAMSGETASFLAGGEFPIPGSDENGNATTTFKPYGIRLSFTPVVLDDGLIHLQLAPEVSDLDPSLSVGGIPALVTRSARTTVELHDGQSLAIAGLLQATNTKAQQQLPWIGQVPVLGALFRSSSYRKQETDLVVIVTPHLVRPARPGEPLASPLDKTRPSNDPEFFLLGTLEVSKEDLQRFYDGTGVNGPFGHIIDLPPGAANVVKK